MQTNSHKNISLKRLSICNFILVNTLFWFSFCSDSYSTYLSVEGTALDHHYSSNTLAIATSQKEIKFVNSLTKALIKTISTSHILKITTLKMSSDASLIFSGGIDFRFYIFNVASSAVVCSGNQLRGDITSATIFNDFNRFAFVTNQGFIYYGNIASCNVGFHSIENNQFIDIISINANNDIWVVDITANTLYQINLPSFTNSSHTFSSGQIRSVFKIPSTSTLGVCTQKGFYVIDYSGTTLFSFGPLSVLTYKCTITEQATNTYVLTVISEQQIIRNVNTNQKYLWNIWKFINSPSYSISIIHEQSNADSRYVGDPQTLDAYAVRITVNSIEVASIASAHNPYLNFYGYTSTCNSGLYNAAGTCKFCTQALPSCSQCSSSPNCNTCFAFKYLDAAKNCVSCPANCYRCSSSTTCVSCMADYVYLSNQCVLSNITGCGTAQWDGGDSITRCTECEIGYYIAEGASCHICSLKYLNCSECDATKCTKCEPNFYMPNPTNGFCEVCSLHNEGCASCINSSYCQACFTDYPYFDTVSSTERYCKQQCYYLCLTCQKYQYDECTGCDVNRTLSGTTCLCNVTEFIVDPDSLACIACRDYISNCQNCSSTTFCDTCDANYYFNNISSAQQRCKSCNYTCLTCDTYWFKCDTCDTGNNYRILDTNNFKCVCPIVSRFQFHGDLVCELCRDHLSHCDTCYNQTYCLICDQRYYIYTISPGNNQCRPCSDPCKECFGTDSNCTQCYSGRQLDKIAGTCKCLYGFYANGTLSCNACSNVLGGCQNCNDDTTCLLCWPNNYFYMDGPKKKCDICKQTCLTCNVWNTVCNDCDVTANRVLNPITSQCNCITGFIQTDGLCLDCTGTFEHCNSCDLSRCYSCDDGYSLAYQGLKCIQCSKTYVGCTKCIGGVCAECNTTAGYELSLTKCICSPGYYFKELLCLPYNMGKKIQRRFPVYEEFSQIMENDSIKIKLYFQCETILMPYQMQESVILTINNETITNYTYYFDNTTLYFILVPSEEISQAEIRVQFINQTIFDYDEYSPSRRIFTFKKNIFLNSTYDLSTNFGSIYSGQVIDNLRWVFTIMLIAGSADIFIYLIFVVHFLPAFLLLDLGIPLPLRNVLEEMVKINTKSLFILSDYDLQFETYEETSLYVDSFGLTGSIIDTKLIDLIVIGSFIVFYAAVLPYIYQKLSPKLPQSKLKELLNNKIILKKYSTIANIFICFAPSFLLNAVINFDIQNYNSSVTFSVGISVMLMAMAAAFTFVHCMILLNTQFVDGYKNQDCYMGSSPLQFRSILYIMPILCLITWGIPLLYRGSGIYVLPIMIVMMLYHIWSFRNWNNFPSKVAYFIKLFEAIFLMLYISGFLLFEISEKYDPISIEAVEVVGLANLVFVIVLFSLSLFESLFLVLLTLYRLFRIACSNLNVVDNLDKEENEEQSEQKTQKMDDKLELPPEISQSKIKSKLTDKREHMKYFKQRHFLNAGHTNINFSNQKTQKLIKQPSKI